MKNYTQAPLPFQGQKRRWNGAFKKALKEFDDCNVFIDLFGGSGLLARMAKDAVRTLWYITTTMTTIRGV